MMNVVPLRSLLATSIRPPWLSTICLTMDSPSPVPLIFSVAFRR
jgi:hypothetical protein